MPHTLKLPAPPQPHISTSKTFPRRTPTPEQLEARAALRTKAPRRRSALAQRLERDAGPSVGKTVLGFAAGFALTLGACTIPAMYWAVNGNEVTGPVLVLSVFGAFLGAAFFSRD